MSNVIFFTSPNLLGWCIVLFFIKVGLFWEQVNALEKKKYFKDSILTYFGKKIVQGLIEKPYTFIWMKNIIMISSMWFIFFTNYWTISWLKRGFFPLNSRSSTIYTLRTTREMCIIQIGHKLHRLKTVRPFFHLVPC